MELIQTFYLDKMTQDYDNWVNYVSLATNHYRRGTDAWRRNIHYSRYLKIVLATYGTIFMTSTYDVPEKLSTFTEVKAAYDQPRIQLQEDIIGYKKVYADTSRLTPAKVILKVLIPKGQYIYTSLEWNFSKQTIEIDKCRCQTFTVLEARYMGNGMPCKREMYSIRTAAFKYQVGKTYTEPDFDMTMTQCTDGLHFFLKRKQAVKF